MRRRVIILGSTGSIGTQALDVIEQLNRLYEQGSCPIGFDVVALAAGNNVALLGEQAKRFPKAELALAHVDVRDLALEEQGRGATFPGRLLSARHGTDAALRLVREVPCDLVVAAMVGSAGLPATLAAVQLGRDVALANKETLVAAGSLVVAAARQSGSRLLPVDSEHSAIWQCLASLGYGCSPSPAPESVARIVLTASGGPFREWSRDRILRATPEDALRHPTWNMGRKVTVDSASLTNKALEVIEAHWLFGVAPDRIEALVHPQSLVHGLVETVEGSILAQIGPSDMRLPIQVALGHPHRAPGASRRLGVNDLKNLTFEPVDVERFPAFSLAHRVLREGGSAGAIFNAANEAGVKAFLGGGFPFSIIEESVAAAMSDVPRAPIRSLEDVLAAEDRATRCVEEFVAQRSGPAGAGSMRR